MDAVLSIGSVNEEVTVAGELLVNTSNAQIGRTTGNAEIAICRCGPQRLHAVEPTPGVYSTQHCAGPEQRTMINGGVDGGAVCELLLTAAPT